MEAAVRGTHFNLLAPGVVLDGDPSDDLAVAPPQAANCVLAIVLHLGVSMTA